MKLPFVVLKNLKDRLVHRWRTLYEFPIGEWNRKIEEGLWRRSQMFHTRHQSGWRTFDDNRRRMLHYLHEFNLIRNNDQSYDLALVHTYLWLHLCLPQEEIHDYLVAIKQALKDGQWKCSPHNQYESKDELYTKGSLLYKVEQMVQHPEDIKCGRTFPDHYSVLEITIISMDNVIASEVYKRPWDVYNHGPRTRDIRGKNVIIDENLEIIPELFPAQVELGCGPSIEAGIPPLNFLHDIYYVTNPTNGKFILNLQDDKLPLLLATNTDEIYHDFIHMYKRCFLAEPTQFYHILKLLYDHKLVVGPIFSNNFDGLPTRMKMKEEYLRLYDAEHIVPKIHFHPSAKSLIVVGGHADRRKVQDSARRAGLKVVYIDPEGYYANDEFIPYKLESPQDGDILYKETSSKAFENIMSRLLPLKEIISL